MKEPMNKKAKTDMEVATPTTMKKATMVDIKVTDFNHTKVVKVAPVDFTTIIQIVIRTTTIVKEGTTEAM